MTRESNAHLGQAHQQEIASAHLVKRVPLAHAEDRVGTVLDRLHAADFDLTTTVYIVDTSGCLQGGVPLSALLRADAQCPLAELMTTAFPRVHPQEDQERVALAAIQNGVTAVPVVDDRGGLLGVVPPGALLEILHQEHVEDLHRLAGVRRLEQGALAALEEPAAQQIWDRLPWLLVGLVGSALATLLVLHFEAALETRVVIAFFVPGIVYLADAIGTQTEAIVIRGLLVSRAPLRTLLAQELRTGMLVGTVLGGLAFPAVLFGFGDSRLALAVSGTLLAAGTVAAGMGLLFPWVLARLGKDPAFGSGPLATILQDLVSLLIYFMLCQVLVV